MAKWNPNSSWNDSNLRGRVRFETFKSQYPDAFFEYLNTVLPVCECESWDEVKDILGVEGINPSRSRVYIKLDTNSELIDLADLDRTDIFTENRGRYDKVELLAGISALMNFSDWESFVDGCNSSEVRNEIVSICCCSEDDLFDIIEIYEDSKIARDYFRDGLKIKSLVPDIEQLKLMPRDEWDQFKKLAFAKCNIRGAADRWNPADILLYYDKPDSPGEYESIDQLNARFNQLVTERRIFPISLKASSAMYGSRSIQRDINNLMNSGKFKTINEDELKQLLHSGLHGVEVSLVTPMRMIPFRNSGYIQQSILNWLKNSTLEEIEQTILLAHGKHELTALHYQVSCDNIILPCDKSACDINLQSILIPTHSNAAWLNFGGDVVAVGRGKPGLHISLERRILENFEVIRYDNAPEPFKRIYQRES